MIKCIWQQPRDQDCSVEIVYEHPCEIKLLQLVEYEELTWENKNYKFALCLVDSDYSLFTLYQQDESNERFKAQSKPINLKASKQSRQ
jgi:hypothetical protein